MKSNLKELVDSANQIREKYRALKRGRFLEAEERLQTFQPLIEPLQELKEQFKKEETPIPVIRPSLPMIMPKTPSRIPVTIPVAPPTLDFGLLATEYLGNYLHKSSLTDTTYGIRREEGKFFIGNKEVEIANDDIVIGDRSYKGKRGLWELITLKEPKNYSQADMNAYKDILEVTSAHLKNYVPGAQIAGNKSHKYTNIIKPLFKTTGGGLREVTGNKIDYVYWDDPNELVDRLRLLWLSRQAGNTGVHNEIDSIIEELRESGIIY